MDLSLISKYRFASSIKVLETESSILTQGKEHTDKLQVSVQKAMPEKLQKNVKTNFTLFRTHQYSLSIKKVFTMRYPCGIQIYDLEATQSDFEQELPIEEAEKVIGGINAVRGMLGHERPPTPPLPCKIRLLSYDLGSTL